MRHNRSENLDISSVPPTQNNVSNIAKLHDFDISSFIPYALAEVMGHWNNRLQHQLRNTDLTNIKARILAVLSFHSGATINELSAYTVIEQSTISRALDSLESQGFVIRTADKKDGRVRRISLSKSGKKAFEESWPHIFNSSNVLLKNVTAKEKKSLLKILHKMQENISSASK